MNRNAIIGCILGTAVGDALGLPYEGVSPSRAPQLLGPPDRYRFVFRRGMILDNTEHTCVVAQSLIEALSKSDDRNEVQLFTKRFARRLRWWILALPAGVGKATARASVKLWFGATPQNAGVFSAGNGPAMRAAIFGAAIDDVSLMLELVRVSSRITHRDPKAEFGEIAVALATRHARDHASPDANLWLEQVVDTLGEDASEFTKLLRQAIESVDAGHSTGAFAQSLGLDRGVTGYTYHTVPVAIHAWLSHPDDFRSAVTTIIQCGGDADTTAAIVGGIVGAGVGRDGIPQRWIEGIAEYPRSVSWMQDLGDALADTIVGKTVAVPTVNPIAVLIRNCLFLFIVLFHGFRRLAPPY
ncbi:ADP-ribosylation/Crystallin J1 [Rhodopirellula maiorica SM1]|uniref:ADP-ribosylation/Crystallin J1 n=1 Tax=Rhodopirellula maiorica SM1 TaxID=1265738 RepID=M5RTY7_9BACT|nr:ADP-ribosylglycohydrolase family protein [Rhodopirellula maiorica]EMI18842.1 ADP-ribosylation/Crystallin J1 [Rhodopirellula maiorica SM1]